MENKENSIIEKFFLKKWTPFIFIIIVGFVIYFQTFFFDFTYLDDNNLILDHQYFLSNPGNIFPSFLMDVFHLFNSSAFYYRPILTISLIFDFQISGIYPFFYHITNVGLHILASCLLFIFLKRIDYKKELSLLFSVIFLIHPVLVQAVAWIPGRNDSLLAVFFLTNFIFFFKYLKDGKKLNLIWALVFFGLSLFTKESGVMILPILLFYLLFIFKERKKFNHKIFFFLSLTGVIILWGFLRHIALNGYSPMGFIDMIKSILINSPAVIQFIGKIFFPFNLSVLPIIKDTTFIYGIIAIIFLTTLIIFTKEKRWNFIMFGFLWFFAFLLPSFIRPNTEIVADFIEHRLYVPIIGMFLVILETDLFKKINFKKTFHLIIMGSIILAFMVITLVYSLNFSNKLSFWQNATLNSPHYPLAHRNLGAMKYLDGEMEEAEKEFKIALELNPNEQMAHNNLGLVYVKRGKFLEAEEEYKKELEVNPYYDNAYFNLGLLYFIQERYNEAINCWERALEINPNFIDARKALVGIYYEQGDYNKLTIHAKELLKVGFELPREILKLLNED